MAVDIGSAILSYGIEKGAATFLLAIGNIVQFRHIQDLKAVCSKCQDKLVAVLEKEVDLNRRNNP